MYETFHEPFKRVVSNWTAVPETPVQSCPKSDRKEDEKEVEDDSKCRKEEPELTVKSALTEAFAKYSGKVGVKKNKSQREKGEEVKQ